jgi:hypothetical protein
MEIPDGPNGSTISTLAALWQAYINLLRFAAWKAGHQPQF